MAAIARSRCSRAVAAKAIGHSIKNATCLIMPGVRRSAAREVTRALNSDHMDSRRNFLGKVASGLGTLAVAQTRVLGANDRIRFGFIGFGDRATDLLNQLRACPNSEAVAFCDVYTKQLERVKSLAPAAATYLDHRRMLEDRSIDAVIVATPQHLHAEHFCAS